jgi:hypothetical protein
MKIQNPHSLFSTKFSCIMQKESTTKCNEYGMFLTKASPAHIRARQKYMARQIRKCPQRKKKEIIVSWGRWEEHTRKKLKTGHFISIEPLSVQHKNERVVKLFIKKIYQEIIIDSGKVNLFDIEGMRKSSSSSKSTHKTSSMSQTRLVMEESFKIWFMKYSCKNISSTQIPRFKPIYGRYFYR